MSSKLLVVRPGGRFIYASLADLACRLTAMLSASEQQCTVGVGCSGAEFAKMIQTQPLLIPVETVTFSKERENRTLRVGAIEYKPVLVDDIAVSGLTLALARQRLSPTPEIAAVGMLYKSRTTRKRIGIEDIRAAVVYSREGGGNPPINAVASLITFPDRLDALAERYFGKYSDQFKAVVRELT